MHGSAWVALFRLIPAKMHETLALLLNSGAEVVVQRILRLEQDFVLLRGRMSGSVDGGIVIIIPYNQIINVSFLKRMTEEDALKIFEKWNGSLPAEVSVSEPARETNGFAVQTGVVEAPMGQVSAPADAAETVVEEAEAPAEPEPSAKSDEPPAPPVKASPPSKSILLARLRARLAGGDAKK